MARCVSNSLDFLHDVLTRSHSSRRHFAPPLRYQIKTSSNQRRLCCRPDSDRTDSQLDSASKDHVETEAEAPKEIKRTTAKVTQNAEVTVIPNKNMNRRIALISTVGALGLFFSKRLEFGVSLKDLVAAAVPYEEALSNGRPTVVEFYADWCEVCRESAQDVYNVQQLYKGRVNFVMMNIDNTKWEQELDKFGVEGIPHFAFLDKNRNEEGNVVGRLPKQFLLENVAALANGEPSVPYARVMGQYSESRNTHQVSTSVLQSTTNPV